MLVLLALIVVGLWWGTRPVGKPARQPAATAATTPVRLSIPASVKPEVAEIARAAWPKIVAACPGFRKYGAEIMPEDVRDWRFDGAKPDVSSVNLSFRVSAGSSSPQVVRYADGHNCDYGITDSGKLRIQKSECASVCKDRMMDIGGADYLEPLR